MKRNHVAIALGIVMGASLLSGCSSTSNSSSTDSGTIYGEVSEVSDDGITIEVGTLKEDAKPDAMSDEENSDSTTTDSTTDDSNKESTDTSDSKSEESSKENTASTEEKDSSSRKDASKSTKASSDEKADGQPSMLEKTGEEKEITVSSDTEITKQSMGGPGGNADGTAPDGNSQPPEKPDGDDSSSDNQPPEKPDGDDNSSEDQSATESSSSEDKNSADQNSDSQPPEKPDGDNNSSEDQSASLDDISKGDIVSITFDSDGSVEKITILMSANGGGQGGGGGQSQAPTSYTAVTEYTSDTTEEGQTLASEGTDENVIHAYEGATVNLSDCTITRNSSDSQGGDNSSFYGVGAAVLESDGQLLLKNSTIETDSKGAAGIFAYADGVVYTEDTKITTTQDTSGGIHVAGGGTLYAWDMDVDTSGESSAAIRSDRGGGTMVVDGGTYTSNGTGSPAIYSTADIAVNDATLTANGSEAICIEGLNSIHLFNSDLTGNMSDNEQNDCTWNVILYQSMSGDSEVGNSTFEMNGGSLTAKNGGMFYTTNTESTITLSDVDITYADDSEFFLKCTGNDNQRGWGTSGANGADCLFTAIKQSMEGNIIWDSISQLDFYMTDGSTLTGAVVDDESCVGDGGDGYCNLYIEKGSKWIVTGDSTLSTLENAGTIRDTDGKTVTIKGTDGTVYVKGDSQYAITVDSYKTTADTSKASSTTSWSDYEVEEPTSLS